jgi:hypothetical protein
MPKEFKSSDLLLTFEELRLRKTYREFVKEKRKHFFLTISHFSAMWDLFQLVDEIWSREIRNASKPGTTARLLATPLMVVARDRFRIACELAFCGCLSEAWAIMRSAIEFGVHGRLIHRKPELMRVWASKNDGKLQKNAFIKEFETSKKTRLFGGLELLYTYWQDYSEWGSHSAAASLAFRMKFQPNTQNVEISSFEGQEDRMAPSLLAMVDGGWQLQEILFEMYRDRFVLDTELPKMRATYERAHARLMDIVLANDGNKI